jgi:hypothetical protein
MMGHSHFFQINASVLPRNSLLVMTIDVALSIVEDSEQQEDPPKRRREAAAAAGRNK